MNRAYVTTNDSAFWSIVSASNGGTKIKTLDRDDISDAEWTWAMSPDAQWINNYDCYRSLLLCDCRLALVTGVFVLVTRATLRCAT